MKRLNATLACIFACALGFGFSVQAEDLPKEHSMTGCLQKGSDPGTFRLTDLGLENGPKVVEIAQTTADLTPHVGHKVKITGTTIKGDDPAAHTMKVTAMKHLAASCP
jgi:hypothetical protein